MTDNERNLSIFNDVLNDMPFAQTARKHGISRQRAYQIVKRLAEKGDLPDGFPNGFLVPSGTAPTVQEFKHWQDAYKESKRLSHQGHKTSVSYKRAKNTWITEVV